MSAVSCSTKRQLADFPSPRRRSLGLRNDNTNWTAGRPNKPPYGTCTSKGMTRGGTYLPCCTGCAKS